MNEGDTHHDEASENQPGWFAHQSENFSSIYFGKVPDHLAQTPGGGFNASQIANAVKLLTDPAGHEIRHEVLATLKRNDARSFLVMLVEDKAHIRHRRELITACWETGLDFSAYLLHFARIAPEANLAECIEISTVIEEMHGPFEASQLSEAYTLLKQINQADKQVILAPVLEKLQSALN
ncbi:MAG: hypothetical protein MUC87_07855 [Bacteroidia bacterium]|nr:hypothetical protein [Bacteroidia bacterium]